MFASGQVLESVSNFIFISSYLPDTQKMQLMNIFGRSMSRLHSLAHRSPLHRRSMAGLKPDWRNLKLTKLIRNSKIQRNTSNTVQSMTGDWVASLSLCWGPACFGWWPGLCVLVCSNSEHPSSSMRCWQSEIPKSRPQSSCARCE